MNSKGPVNRSDSLFLGIDGGGTKSHAVLADSQGRVLQRAKAGPSNFQDIGVRATTAALAGLLRAFERRAGKRLKGLRYACFGMAGADRPEDYGTLRRIIRGLVRPQGMHVVTDVNLVLRLAVPDGIGIALISGTGTNSVGVNAKGRELQLGGWCHSGGSGGEIGQLALQAAIESYDGRGPKSLLESLIQRAWRLKKLEDMLEYGYFDQPRGPSGPRRQELVPLVFQAADKGDRAARAILKHTAWELGRMARALCTRLFPGTRDLAVALGGSILQKAKPPYVRRAVMAQVRALRPRARFYVPRHDPVFGALAYAYDAVGLPLPPRLASELQPQRSAA